MIFVIEKSEETIFKFLHNSVTVAWFWLRIIMETQKIANLLGTLIINLQNLQQENGMLLMI